jgi:mRNA interferase RelE/StbE
VKYGFDFRPAARRQLRALPQAAAMGILSALTPLGEDPRRLDADTKKLSGPDDLYRLHVGIYRVIYQIRDSELIILVVHVGHRRDVYRAL